MAVSTTIRFRLDFDWTAIRPPFDSSSTATRPRYTTIRRPTLRP